MNHRITSSAVLLAAICTLPVLVSAQGAAQTGEATVITPKQLKWGDVPPSLPKGGKLAMLHGDPAKEGPFALRVRMPANYRIAPHSHPNDYSVTVISGSPSLGMGEKVDTKAMHVLPAGSYHYLPAKMNHYWIAKGPVEIEVQGNGPFSMTYVNPQDDPQKMAARK